MLIDVFEQSMEWKVWPN